jgi:hypothetical protein
MTLNAAFVTSSKEGGSRSLAHSPAMGRREEARQEPGTVQAHNLQQPYGGTEQGTSGWCWQGIAISDQGVAHGRSDPDGLVSPKLRDIVPVLRKLGPITDSSQVRPDLTQIQARAEARIRNRQTRSRWPGTVQRTTTSTLFPGSVVAARLHVFGNLPAEHPIGSSCPTSACPSPIGESGQRLPYFRFSP